ncbi:SHOCT domain-containing protein [Halorubrum sp. 48-1-W]|uniref:SHOCT domain-containing protein n=1 Tax=Halorubrum sp. 48-1-W TaxID=2249761 RepID=UPI000DCBDF54|nr:SHOCT domain-containing protein [Halorubrum sp. 48-1-W]RAW44884.1 SHOCT domain-containing protein [Halorubrum sp. 48-1-W]
MTDPSPLDRAKANATEIASTVVTGVWLAALFLGFGWWLPFMLFGYVVVVPVVSMLFDDEEEEEGSAEAGSEDRSEREWRDREADRAEEPPEGTADAIDRLRTRYAEGDLTDEQFERKLDKLLETETPEDTAEWRTRERDRTLDRDRS